MDAVTFSHLLGFGKEDRKRPWISKLKQLVISEYQYMYMDGHPTDGKTTWLKPYYYVLNNSLCQILYPKGGDSTYLRDDSLIVLDCFGEHLTKFSISEYIWDRIT